MAVERERFFPKGEDRQAFDEEGSPCEECGFRIPDHDWVDLDPNGFVFNCSILQKENNK
jgi:hypothetical protein